VVITETATGCSTTMNNFNFTSVPEITSTASITDINGSPNVGDINDFTVSNVVGGYGPPYTVSLISGGSTYATVTVPNQNGTAYIYDIPAGDYTYSVSDTLNGTTACGKTYTTPMTATVQQFNEETFYHIHTGSGSVYPFNDLMTSNGAYLIGDTTYTVYNMGIQADFDIVMTNLIDLGNGTNSSPDVGDFEFAGPITGDDCDVTWTFNASAGDNYYYLAVPNNSSFPENLRTANPGVLQKSCDGGNYNAYQEKPFTYNGEAYTLYKIQSTTGTTGDTWGFK
jgi:hypothetical protein